MINIAIIGCGSIAKRHAKWANKYGNLVAVCDIDASKAEKLAKQYKCIAYYDSNFMLRMEKHIDLVAICTPNGLHAKHTIAALKFGCNVLCEKPMALNTGDCEQMIHAAETVNKRLFIVKQNRFNDTVVAIKRIIATEKLGRILSVHLTCAWARDIEYYENSDWKGDAYMDGGILYTQFSHFIDLLYHLIGDVDKVQAFSNNFIHRRVADFPDTFVTALKFTDGTLGTAHFTINCYKDNMEGSLTIFGEKGTIKIGGKYLNKIEYQNIRGIIFPDINESNCNDYGSYQGSSSKHDEVYKNVIGVLEKGDKIMTDCLDGLKTIQIIQKIREASK